MSHDWLLTLPAYGGYGFTTRNWGLTLDTMISAQVVLANGTIATASKDQNPDLFFVRVFLLFCLVLLTEMGSRLFIAC